jgi:hypothetical protein
MIYKDLPIDQTRQVFDELKSQNIPRPTGPKIRKIRFAVNDKPNAGIHKPNTS